MLTLYLTPGASSMAPHIALEEIGVDFGIHTISLAKRENRTPEYLALNPCGTVPVLLVDGRALTEVAAILFFLAKRFSYAGLLPDEDIATEARAIEWMSFIASSIHPTRRQEINQARDIWNVAECRLNGGEWALGRYSIVDIHLFRLFWRYHQSLDLRPGEYGALLDHYARMTARPAVQRVLATESAMGYESVPGRLPPPPLARRV